MLAGLATFPAAHAVADRDCGDFNTQQQAQDFYLSQGGPQSDPHRLDADNDGRACDSLPCPCGASGGGGGTGSGSGSGSQATLRQNAKVVKVIDGDTVRVRLLPRGGRKDVRLIGIDTPEVHGGVQCWGPQASAAMKQMLPVGTRVKLVSDPTQKLKDRYNRLLRYVLKGKKDINRAQLSRGNARVYIYDRKPFKRTRAYKSTQAQAKRADRGMWGHC
ncbi:hypothetical protein GCM10028867_23590 [Nocardioides pacificus]